MEEVISVGNEFTPVEALWSQFENVMAKGPTESNEAGEGLRDGIGDDDDNERDMDVQK